MSKRWVRNAAFRSERESLRMQSLLRRILNFRPPSSSWNNDEIIREALFSIERLEQHAASLAQAQSVTNKPPARRSLNTRLRENGGQYTHAAAWSVIAFAQLGQGDKAAQLFSLLNPINRTSTRAGLRRYKVEPYAVAADVYSMPPHVGRGGWTWYTGSAGWLYRAGLEGILGFRKQGDSLLLEPCIPNIGRTWRSFSNMLPRAMKSWSRIPMALVAA